MRHRDISLTIALCASLTAHALLSRALADRYVAANRHIYLAALPGEAVTEDHILQPALRPPALELDLGSPDGKGNALDTSPGDEPMQARQADDNQALGRIDPPGTNAPRHASSALEDSAAAQQAVAMSTPPIPFGVASSPTDLVGPAPKHQPATPVAAVAPPAPAPAPSPAQAHEAIAAASATPGEPAPQLDSESDAFSKEGSVKFQHGKTDVQFGRKHKLIRPRFDLAVQDDLLTMQLPIKLVLKLRLDGKGNVAAADVEKSSGSKLLDHAVKVTSFKWWFEPKKSKDTPDEFLFTIVFL
jgi:TonB family protein